MFIRAITTSKFYSANIYVLINKITRDTYQPIISLVTFIHRHLRGSLTKLGGCVLSWHQVQRRI